MLVMVNERAQVDNSLDQFGLLELGHRLVAALELRAGESVAVLQRWQRRDGRSWPGHTGSFRLIRFGCIRAALGCHCVGPSAPWLGRGCVPQIGASPQSTVRCDDAPVRTPQSLYPLIRGAELAASGRLWENPIMILGNSWGSTGNGSPWSLPTAKLPSAAR